METDRACVGTASLEIVTDVRPTLNVAHVLQGQGMEPDSARPEIVAVAQEMLAEAESLLSPAGICAIFPLHATDERRVTLEGGAAFEGRLVARALKGATRAALVVCTIGPALEERAAALTAEGDLLRALALDGAGVAAVGRVSWLVGERIRQRAEEQGLHIGMRASPGQERFPIQQQRVLFGLLPADRIGVRLTESCLMLPRKSVSYLVGLGPEMRPDATACDFCSKQRRCRWRAR